jgi:CubicO group peptidase (beta-lactamase class C family)
MTKAFTSTTAAILVDEGVVEWDTPVRGVLPEFKLKDPVATENATLRDCLAHRTGVGRNSIQGFNLADDPSWWLPRLRHLEPEGVFRDRGIYSGVMVTVAGLMLERASETPWEQLVAARLLEPLGMHHTTVAPPPGDGENFARPHLVIDNAAVEIDLIVSTPDVFQSGLWSSADDMIRWMEFLLAGGRHEDRVLVSPEAFSEMWTPQIVMRRAYNPRRTSLDAYGFGWRIGTRHDTLELSHGGGGAGYTSHILLMPAMGLGITVLTNTALNPVPDLADNWLVNRVFDIDAPDPREGAKRMVARMAESQRAAHLQALEERDSSLPPLLPLAAYTGTYSDFVYGDVEVGTNETGLTFAYHGVQTDVDHLHGNVFLFSSPLFDDLRSEFEVTPEGEVAALRVPIGHNGAEVVFRRPPAD